MSSGAASRAGGGLRPMRCKAARISTITARRLSSERRIASSLPVSSSSRASAAAIFCWRSSMVWARSTSAAASFARSARIAATSASILARCSCEARSVSSIPRSSSRRPLSASSAFAGFAAGGCAGDPCDGAFAGSAGAGAALCAEHGGANERHSARAIAKPSASGTAFIGSFRPPRVKSISIAFASEALASSRNMAEARRRGAAALTQPARRSCPMRGQDKSEPVRGPPRQGAPPPFHSRERAERRS